METEKEEMKSTVTYYKATTRRTRKEMWRWNPENCALQWDKIWNSLERNISH